MVWELAFGSYCYIRRSKFFRRIFRTFIMLLRLITYLFLKIAPSCLFFLIKQILIRPSHSKKFISGRGFLGSILTTLLSTFGGGRKLFFDTFMRCSTFESNWTLTLSLNLTLKNLPAIQVGVWLRNQSQSELSLKHQNCTTKHRSMREQLKNDWGRDIVRHVCDA